MIKMVQARQPVRKPPSADRGSPRGRRPQTKGPGPAIGGTGPCFLRKLARGARQAAFVAVLITSPAATTRALIGSNAFLEVSIIMSLSFVISETKVSKLVFVKSA